MCQAPVLIDLAHAAQAFQAAAHQVSNPDNAPHLEFVDMGGHGYAVVTAGPQAVESEFVASPARSRARRRPMEARYRVTHRAERWRADERPKLQQRVVEGDAKLSI